MSDESALHTLVLAVNSATRLPEALTGVALRVPGFRVIRDEHARCWYIHINATHSKLIQLLNVVPNHVAEVHSHSLTAQPSISP